MYIMRRNQGIFLNVIHCFVNNFFIYFLHYTIETFKNQVCKQNFFMNF